MGPTPFRCALMLSLLGVWGCSASSNGSSARDADLPMADAAAPDAAAPTLPARQANPTCHAPAMAITQGREGLPARLSETGCFLPGAPPQPVPAAIPYAINAPLWSDGLDKERWLALPDRARITIKPDGDLELPAGTVLIKTFRLGDRRVETRFFVRHPGGDWSGYTYDWNDEGTDATLLDEGSRRRPLGDRQWHLPTRAECNKCHTAGAGFSLGLEVTQLDREFTYPNGARVNQLVAWERMGMFDSPLPSVSRPPLAAPSDENAPLEDRARAYLHANCSNCHRPEVEGSGTTDLRFTTPLAATMACDAEPLRDNLGAGPEARIIAPGNPDKSMIILRMLELGRGRMPEFASLVVDQQGVSVVSAWIRALSGCR